MSDRPDRTIELLLDLDGYSFAVDAKGHFVVRFVVKQVQPSSERPHGLSYSLTLHDKDGARLVGFDNAHPSPARGRGTRGVGHDHRHRVRTTRSYQYRDAASLLADFWAEVEAVLRERGVWR
jgi:hypothetical protein